MFKVSQEILLKSNDSVNHSTVYGNYRSIARDELPVFKSDATQIRCSGFGLSQANLNKTNEFTINATKAGNNILFIGICGPNGPCDEVSVKHIGENVYNVTYKVQHPGYHVIAVKWGDEHIPNSPFHLESV